FDLATVLTIAKDKTIGVGVSMGDHYYAQPYVYVSPYPAPKLDPNAPTLQRLPAGGHWHGKDFFGAVGGAQEPRAQEDAHAAATSVISEAIEASKRWLA